MHITRPPFFTIITATYNAAETLPRLLQSLAEQTCQDFVWLCQDGESRDSSMAIIEQWRDKLSISLERCKDTGIYDAWNKAIAREGDKLGEWVLFLGADDLLADCDVLEKAKSILATLPSDIIFGVGEKQDFSDNGETYEQSCTNIDVAFVNRMLGTPFPHTALFSRGILFKNERFDSSFQISADYDWILRLWKNPSQALALNLVTTKMALGGISTLHGNANKIFYEKIKICLKHFDNKKWKYCLILFLYFIENKVSKPKLYIMHICKKNYLLSLLWEKLHLIRKKILSTK